MSKECADCGNERIMLCPFCEHDFSEASKQKDAELTALREAVRVLGEECWMWRLTNDFVDRDTHGRYGPQKQAMAKTNANPIALAAVEAKA